MERELREERGRKQILETEKPTEEEVRRKKRSSKHRENGRNGN
jgi:hypothetical protein